MGFEKAEYPFKAFEIKMPSRAAVPPGTSRGPERREELVDNKFCNTKLSVRATCRRAMGWWFEFCITAERPRTGR